MKLNMGILRDELGSLVVGERLSGSQKLELDGARFLEGGADDAQKSHAFICCVGELESLATPRAVQNLICIGGDFKSGALAQIRGEAIILEDELEKEQVLNLALSAFERFSNWERRLLLAIIDDREIGDVLDLAHEELRNPIALLDNAQYCIAMSGELGPEYEQTVWQDLVSLGYVSAARYGSYDRDYVERLEKSNEAYLTTAPNHGDHMQMICNINANGSRIANFGLVDIAEPFTVGQQSIVNHLAKLFVPVLESRAGRQVSASGLVHILMRILNGYEISGEALGLQLSKLRWTPSDAYRWLAVDWRGVDESDSRPAETRAEYTMRRLQQAMPSSCVVQHEEDILALVHGKNDDEVLKTSSLVIPLLEDLRLRAGLSLPFGDVGLSRTFARQARFASKVDDDGAVVVRYENHVLRDVAEQCAKSFDMASVCHPGVLRLYDYDRQTGSDLVGDLYAYLMSGRKPSKAAERQFVHRNTFMYRLERLNNLASLDLDDDEVFLHALLSCVVLRRGAD